MIILCLSSATLALLMTLFTSPIFSQVEMEIYTPMIFLHKGIEASEKENYEDAVSYFEKIHPNDTLYNEAVLQLVLNHRQLKNYQKAILLCDKGIDLNKEYVRQFYLNKAIALDSLGRKDAVFKTMRASSDLFPMDHWKYVHQYYIHQGHGEFDKALQSLKDGIAINPLEPTLHALLGLEAAKSGQLTRSILPLTFACLLSPEGKSTNSWLVAVNKIASEDIDEKAERINWGVDGERFEELDLLIKNYVALRNDYKMKSKLKYALIKQLHLIMDQIDPRQEGFWTKTYCPLLKKINEQNRFIPFSYLLSYSSNSADHKRIFAREIDEIKEFNTWMLNELQEQFRKRPAPEFLSILDTVYCWYSDTKLSAMSGYSVENKSITGPYYHFGENGHIDIIGQLNSDGGATGFWKYIDENGHIYRTSNYLNNELDGETIFYLENGEIGTHRMFSADEANGLTKRYKAIGHLYETSEYRNGQLNGEQIGYFANGNVSYKLKNIDNKSEGEFVYYFQNGAISIEGSFQKNEIHGPYIKYHENGQLFQKYEANAGKLSGEYLEYHDNGQIANNGVYVNSIQAGIWKKYDRLGTLIEEKEFDEKGKLTGISKNFDIHGRLHIEYEYIKENLEIIRSYDTLGNVISEDKERRGKLPFKVLYPNGALLTEGVFINNKKEEEWRRHSPYEKLLSREIYSNGELNGPEIDYYADGTKKSVTNYRNDNIDSLFLSYYEDGSLRYQLNYSDGELEGRLQEYSEKGVKIRDEYYLDDNLHGWQEYYTEKGLLYFKKKVNRGYPVRLIWFDHKQDTIGDSNIKNGLGIEKMYFSNGQLGRERHYKGGELNGAHKSYYPNGQLRVHREYVNDKTEGTYTTYYENGKIKYQGEYYNDSRIGQFKMFDLNGDLISITNYDNGKKHGTSFEYNDQSVVIHESNYRLGELHGKKMYYSWNGDLQSILFYDNGTLTAYSGPLGLDDPSKRVAMLKGNVNIDVKYENGSTSFSCEFRHGSFYGVRKSYYPNGKLNEESAYKSGWFHGARSTFYSDGVIKSKENYFYGNLDGLCEYYYPNGKLKYSKTYIDGDLEGKARRLNEDGSLISEQLYFADTMMELK